MNTPGDERDWQDLFRDEGRPADSGFTLRVLAALPPRRRSERLRVRVILAAALVAAVLGLLALPALAPAGALDLRHWTVWFLYCGVAALTLWGASTAAE